MLGRLWLTEWHMRLCLQCGLWLVSVCAVGSGWHPLPELLHTLCFLSNGVTERAAMGRLLPSHCPSHFLTAGSSPPSQSLSPGATWCVASTPLWPPSLFCGVTPGEVTGSAQPRRSLPTMRPGHTRTASSHCCVSWACHSCHSCLGQLNGSSWSSHPGHTSCPQVRLFTCFCALSSRLLLVSVVVRCGLLTHDSPHSVQNRCFRQQRR